MTNALLVPWRRPISGTERAWVVAEQVFGAFINQLVLEGEGDLDPDRWRAAVARAAEANPGARVVWRGRLGGAAWVDSGLAPPVTEVDGSAWDGLSEQGAPFLRRPLDPLVGPTTEVLLVRGAPGRVVFRTAHATMDGGGTLAFARDVLACLRGEPPAGHADPVTETDLAGPGPKRPPLPPNAITPTGRPVPGVDGVTWRRLRLATTPRGLLGLVIARLAAEARRHGEGTVRIDVPADLRRDRPDVRSTANLTGVVGVVVEPGDTGPAILDRVRAALADGEPARGVRAADFIRWVPLALARWYARRGLRQHTATGLYGASAVVSNLGRLDATVLSGGGFTARRAWFVPPGTPVTACFVTLAGTDDGLDVAVALPRALATDGRLDALVEALHDALGAHTAAA